MVQLPCPNVFYGTSRQALLVAPFSRLNLVEKNDGLVCLLADDPKTCGQSETTLEEQASEQKVKRLQMP